MSRYKEVCKSYVDCVENAERQRVSMQQAEDALKTQALMNIDITLAHMLDLMEEKYKNEKKAQCKQSRTNKKSTGLQD
jgi:hypothetical protein